MTGFGGTTQRADESAAAKVKPVREFFARALRVSYEFLHSLTGAKY